MKFIFLLGRILFSWIFIMKSIDHFSGKMIDQAMSAGVPLASFLVPFAGVLALLGGLSILFGYKVRFGACLLVIFLLPTTFAMHRFWASDDMLLMMMHQYCFLKNVSLLGASLMMIYLGAGPLSIDNR